MAALPPADGAVLGRGSVLAGLAVDADVHDVVAADGAELDLDVPRPERHGRPLLDLEPRLLLALLLLGPLLVLHHAVRGVRRVHFHLHRCVG